MTPSQFASTLAQEGFQETVTVERPANGSLDAHTHPFEAKALILQGDIRIRCGEDERLYQVGDVFHLQAEVAHAEFYGAQGVTYMVGRKPA